MTAAVIGREVELGAIEAFLAEVERAPAALVLFGEAGIGKTILWEAGVDAARDRFGRVLTCRSVETEASLSFAGLSDLVTPVFAEVAPLLPPLRRRALEVALLLAEPGEEPPDPRAIGLALLDVLVALAEQGPVLVALDDIQWLDPSSAAVLQIALRRLREEPVGVLLTTRDVDALAAPFELERALPETNLAQLRIGPLSLGALHHLLGERLSLELTRGELARVQETSAGNPFFALELGRELERQEVRSDPGKPLPVPSNLSKLLGARLARLTPETREILVMAASAGRPTIDVIAASGGGQKGVLDALRAAVQEGVVELDGSRVRFSHPLLSSVCYEQASPWERRAAHRALADAATDIEERARHLALAAEGPDAEIATGLDTAAEQAVARGATAAAAELSELAAELTPADPGLTRHRRLQAAHFHRLAGDGERSAALLQELLEEVPSGVERADILLALVMTHRADNPTTFQLCEEALSEAAGDDARSARILAYRSQIHNWAADTRAAVSDSRAVLEIAERAGDPALLATAIGRVGTIELYAAAITPGLLERGAEIEDQAGLSLDYFASPRVALARKLMSLGELDRSRGILEELPSKAAARGDEVTRAMTLWNMSLLEWLAGRWQLALEHASAANELAEQIQHSHVRMWAGRVKALIEADLGLVEEARSSAEGVCALSEANSKTLYFTLTLAALGRLELALGNLEVAGGYLRDLPGQLLAGGVNDPTLTVWADAIETLLCLGVVRRQAQQRSSAREALEEALAIFEELGARLWAEKARAEVRRISGRRASDELTETERRVATLAAQGLTSKEIASALFIGVSTVEMHLSHVYRKLGVRRAGLGHRLSLDDAAKTAADAVKA
jgi:DNA-binding CsgD family transcriptional regulator